MIVFHIGIIVSENDAVMALMIRSGAIADRMCLILKVFSMPFVLMALL
jgi:hypothetical protein